jgi:shikimate kinase
MQSASREERIAALRRFREHRRQSVNEDAETRRRRRLTARLGEAFGVRTRGARETSPSPTGAAEPSSSLAVPNATAGAARSIAEESIPEEEPTTIGATNNASASRT